MANKKLRLDTITILRHFNPKQYGERVGGRGRSGNGIWQQNNWTWKNIWPEDPQNT